MQAFHCLTKKGLVLSQKKFEISFEYTPQELGLQESFWTFKIPEHKIEIPFVLVGTAEEPGTNIYYEHC